jgi:hypothetical protein
VNLDDLRTEYDTARRHTHRIVEGLDDTEVLWRPHPDSSAIGWHLGHVAAVNHFMLRNLTAAEPRPAQRPRVRLGAAGAAAG